jgi:hypothetical protein
MRSFDLLQKFAPEKIIYTVSELLGDGADGECYSIKSDKSKVIKYSILYDLDYSGTLLDKYSSIERSLQYVQNQHNSCVAKLYDFGLLYKGNRKTVVGTQEYIIYFSIFENLYKLSDDEKKAMHSVLNFFENKVNSAQVNKELINLSFYLDFDYKKLFIFYNSLIDLSEKFNHNDLHIRNIMRDKCGNIKLIDFDKSTIKEI